MSKRCASCGSFNPRQSMKAPGDWVDYLETERDYGHAGTVVLPLCRECFADARDLPEDATADVTAFLDDVDVDLLVDEVTG